MKAQAALFLKGREKLADALLCSPEPVELLAFGKEGDLCSGGRSGGAHICHIICKGDIRFMSDGGDDGNLGVKDCFGNDLLVKGKEIFQRAASSSDNQKISKCVAVHLINCPGNLLSCSLSLDFDRV